MSWPNSGSVWPNGVPLRNSWISCQSPIADAPAMSPVISGMPMPNSRMRLTISER